MVLAATFRVKNNNFAERLRTAIQEDETTQIVLKEMSHRNIKNFTEEDRFLLF